MKFTSKDLAKLLGIKIGDKIRLSNGEIADVIEDYILDYNSWRIGLHSLVDEDFEILPHTKKVGEQLCKDLECGNCPLNILNCTCGGCLNLYGNLAGWYERFHDKELYEILKARLDKEVE